MNTRGRPARRGPQAGVRQWQAEQARKIARAAGDRRPPGGRFSWPRDRAVIVAETVAAGSREPLVIAGPREVCGPGVLAAARMA